MMSEEQIFSTISKYDKVPKRLSYGTAGFRDRFDLPMHGVFARVGALACLRSRACNSKCIGVMVTASHNPEQDNGVKIVDEDGGMMAQSWEKYAEDLVNCDAANFFSVVENICRIEKIPSSTPAVVLVCRDTRYHSLELSNCVLAGVSSSNGICHDIGEGTTPQLHYIIEKLNSSNFSYVVENKAADWLAGYYNDLGEGLSRLLTSASRQNELKITVDASFGVGSVALLRFFEKFNAKYGSVVVAEIRNKSGEGKVNEGCGAELLQKNQVPPANFSPDTDRDALMCSFDGDGDRIVFHSFLSSTDSDPPTWVLLDGDKIAALMSVFLHGELLAAGLNSDFTIGVVQTAYANGSSSRFLRSRGIQPVLAKTGVKFVHHKAVQYDMGVYFEANGHGTVVFSPRLAEAIHSHVDRKGESEVRRNLAFARLKAALLLINQAVGDALSDMLCCIAAMQVMDMSLRDWHQLYTDLPSKQIKVNVRDKSQIACSEDETRVLRPAELQEDLDACMAKVKLGRCFIRPSGTEDVVRVYAEAETKEEADWLAAEAREIILKHLS